MAAYNIFVEGMNFNAIIVQTVRTGGSMTVNEYLEEY